MATVSRGLPERPHLDVPKREARELLAGWRTASPAAFERIQKQHPKFRSGDAASLAGAGFKLSDAQLVVAREYGFSNWTALKQRVARHSAAGLLQDAIATGRTEAVVAILREHSELLHLPLSSGNWGPPMSHAANLGQLEVVQACAALGARDTQHAFERAVLQGQIECARWLHAHGARLGAGIIMGSSETLKASGFQFLLELGAPLTNEHGERLAPLAMVLETYSRNTAGKHAILDHFAQRGYELPETPVIALHRGDIEGLEKHLRRDPRLLERRFSLREIYPTECGCTNEGRSGMHWTPVDGTTLLHLSIDFREREIFDWLLARGADVNARATVDAEGFGGHTPLFNALVCGPWRDTVTVPALLRAGASTELRANLRKFLDWRETPAWHVASNVTAAEWGAGFPDLSWVNSDACALIKSG
jgi:hypothetical protein